MKKTLLTIFLLMVLAMPVFAKNSDSNNGYGQQNQVQTQEQIDEASGNQVQNRNEVQTQNQGEDSQLQINTQEQERLRDGSGDGSQNRNQMAEEKMSEVAKQVQLLLDADTTGGIGEEIRAIAQAQNQAQPKIREQLTKIESKGKLAKFLTGADYGAIKKLNEQIAENQLRIEQLIELQNQLTNESEITLVQETIQALNQVNTELQAKVLAEEQTRSMFGWLFKLFAK